MPKAEKYIVVCGGSVRRPGRPKTGPGSDEMLRFEVLTNGKPTIVSAKDLPPEYIASMLDNGIIQPYEGAADASPLKADESKGEIVDTGAGA